MKYDVQNKLFFSRRAVFPQVCGSMDPSIPHLKKSVRCHRKIFELILPTGGGHTRFRISQVRSLEEVVLSTDAIREIASRMSMWDIMLDSHGNELDEFCTFCLRKWKANHHV
jgi:hypothetical protein